LDQQSEVSDTLSNVSWVNSLVYSFCTDAVRLESWLPFTSIVPCRITWSSTTLSFGVFTHKNPEPISHDFTGNKESRPQVEAGAVAEGVGAGVGVGVAAGADAGGGATFIEGMTEAFIILIASIPNAGVADTVVNAINIKSLRIIC